MAKQQTFVKSLEEEATAQLDAVREFRKYQGTNPDYRQKAKMAISVISAYVRLRATIANERSNELIEMRLLGGVADAESRRRLAPASDDVDDQREAAHA